MESRRPRESLTRPLTAAQVFYDPYAAAGSSELPNLVRAAKRGTINAGVDCGVVARAAERTLGLQVVSSQDVADAVAASPSLSLIPQSDGSPAVAHKFGSRDDVVNYLNFCFGPAYAKKAGRVAADSPGNWVTFDVISHWHKVRAPTLSSLPEGMRVCARNTCKCSMASLPARSAPVRLSLTVRRVVFQMVTHHITAARIKDAAPLVSCAVMNTARTALRVKPEVVDDDILTAVQLYLEDNTPITITLQQLLHRTPTGQKLRALYVP